MISLDAVIALGGIASNAGDLAIISAFLAVLGTVVTLVVKAGPGWNSSLIKNATGEATRLNADLKACRQDARRSSDRAERYRIQLIRAGITPYDEAATE